MKLIIKILKPFAKIFKSEFKSQFSISIIVGIIVAALVPLISPLAMPAITHNNPDPEYVSRQTFGQLSRMFGEAVVYTLIIRLTMIFREKTTLDRNRTLYLKYNKNQVLLGKTLVDILIFISSIIIVILLGTLITVFKNKGELSSNFIGNIVVYIIAIIFLYAIMAMGIRWAMSSLNKKIVKGLIIAIIILITAGLYSVLGIVEGVVTKRDNITNELKFPIMDTIKENKFLFAFIPFLNISIIPLVIGGQIETWTLIPFIFEMLIIICLIWKSLSKNLKTYLTV